MISKDHRMLGELLAKQLIKNTSPLATHLFVTVCFPDHNPLTYIRGLCMGHPFKTHFLFLSYPEIQRLCSKLENRKRLYIWDYYTLGALTHYVADAFTYPHNEHYTGSMLNHTKYEHDQLHRVFEQYLTEDFQAARYMNDDMKPLGEFFSELHDFYMQERPEALCDTQYICRACAEICAVVLEKECVMSLEGSRQKTGGVQA